MYRTITECIYCRTFRKRHSTFPDKPRSLCSTNTPNKKNNIIEWLRSTKTLFCSIHISGGHQYVFIKIFCNKVSALFNARVPYICICTDLPAGVVHKPRGFPGSVVT